MLGFVAIARHCTVEWYAFSYQSWISYEYEEGMLIILRAMESLKRVLADGIKK